MVELYIELWVLLLMIGLGGLGVSLILVMIVQTVGDAIKFINKRKLEKEAKNKKKQIKEAKAFITLHEYIEQMILEYEEDKELEGLEESGVRSGKSLSAYEFKALPANNYKSLDDWYEEHRANYMRNILGIRPTNGGGFKAGTFIAPEVKPKKEERNFKVIFNARKGKTTVLEVKEPKYNVGRSTAKDIDKFDEKIGFLIAFLKLTVGEAIAKDFIDFGYKRYGGRKTSLIAYLESKIITFDMLGFSTNQYEKLFDNITKKDKILFNTDRYKYTFEIERGYEKWPF